MRQRALLSAIALGAIIICSVLVDVSCTQQSSKMSRNKAIYRANKPYIPATSPQQDFGPYNDNQPGQISPEAARSSPPVPVVPDEAPAERLDSGTWQAHLIKGEPTNWQFRDGVIYYDFGPKGGLSRAGAYEVLDATEVRTVIFQDCEEEGWDENDPATYPWTTSEASYLGSNRVWLLTPYGLMTVAIRWNS
jgi:hypothetical protein